MTPEAIALIIEACAKASVRVLEMPGLRLEFGEAAPARSAVTPPKPIEPTPSAVTTLTEIEHEKQTQQAIELDEAQLKEDRLRFMLIEHPLQAEALIAKGELDVEDEGEDGDGS